MATRNRIGFTLVELLVVIAIIGILIALLLPAVQAAREAARTASCKNNFRQVGLALQNYYSANKSFPSGIVAWSASSCASPKGTTGLYYGWGWGTYILPYLEEDVVYRQFDFHGTDYQTPRTNLLGNHNLISAYLCPDDPNAPQYINTTGITPAADPSRPWEDSGMTNMAGVADSLDWTCDGWNPKLTANGILFNKSKIRINDIIDGTSKTLIVGEVLGPKPGTTFSDGSSSLNVGFFWVTWDILDTAQGINANLLSTSVAFPWWAGQTSFGSYHPGGCHFAIADGSVQFISEQIDQKLLSGLATRAGGEAAQGY